MVVGEIVVSQKVGVKVLASERDVLVLSGLRCCDFDEVVSLYDCT